MHYFLKKLVSEKLGIWSPPLLWEVHTAHRFTLGKTDILPLSAEAEPIRNGITRLFSLHPDLFAFSGQILISPGETESKAFYSTYTEKIYINTNKIAARDTARIIGAAAHELQHRFTRNNFAEDILALEYPLKKTWLATDYIDYYWIQQKNKSERFPLSGYCDEYLAELRRVSCLLKIYQEQTATEYIADARWINKSLNQLFAVLKENKPRYYKHILTLPLIKAIRSNQKELRRILTNV